MSFLKNHKTIGVIVPSIVASCLVTGGVAMAGASRSSPVTFDRGDNASGSFRSTRNESPASDFIMCGIESSLNNGLTIYCTATSKGVTRICEQDNPDDVQKLLPALQSITSSSFLTFNFRNGVCTSILVSNNSKDL